MPETACLFVDRLKSPVGELVLVADGGGSLRVLGWYGAGKEPPELMAELRRQCGPAVRLEQRRNPGGLTAAIGDYFHGDVAVIDALPVAAEGTAFQQSVWSALRQIPCGSTVAYSDLARLIGRPAAVRAVGLANGSNPVAIVVPCHRVVGKDGTLTGYGGGLDRKRWLLAHEAAARPGPLFPR
jgi:methylated-DNA-[protein]-cysteine S-methyltransferase